MFRFYTSLQCVSDILHYSKRIICDVSELLVINVKGVTPDSKTVIKFHFPNPLSDFLQRENVIMPKSKKVNSNRFKPFQKINSNKKKSDHNKKVSVPENCPNRFGPEHKKDQTSSSLPQSVESSSENTDSDVLIVFDSKEQGLRDVQQEVIPTDIDKIDVSVITMGNSDSFACGTGLQQNPGGWYCSATTWACSNVQSTCSSELPAVENMVLKSVQPHDGASETGTASTKGISVQRKLVLCNSVCSCQEPGSWYGLESVPDYTKNFIQSSCHDF